MRLPRLDVIFGLAAPAINVLVERARIALLEIGDDEACVGAFGANFDAGDDPLDAAPARGSVVELAEAARLALFRRGLVARFHAGFEVADVAAKGRGRRDAEDIIEPVGATKVENLGRAIMTVAAQHYLRLRPVGARMARNRRRRKALISLPPGRLAGRSTAAMKRPSPSNTTIG